MVALHVYTHIHASIIFLVFSFYTLKRSSVKSDYCRYHGFCALIRLLCDLPATHPLGTEPWFDIIPPEGALMFSLSLVPEARKGMELFCPSVACAVYNPLSTFRGIHLNVDVLYTIHESNAQLCQTTRTKPKVHHLLHMLIVVHLNAVPPLYTVFDGH